MFTRTATRGQAWTRRLVGAATATALGATALVAAAAVPASAADAPRVVSSGSLTWGFKQSFRTYVASGLNTELVGERVVLTAPATFAEPGVGEARPYVFPVNAGSFDPAALKLDSDGGVTYSFPSHYFTISLSDVRIGTVGTQAVVTADARTVVTSDFGEFEAGEYQADDVAIANIGHLAVTTSATGATFTGTQLTLTAAGRAAVPLYPVGEVLDDISGSLETATPTVAVSRTSFERDGSATVTVEGSGFVPQASLAARPPLAGKPGGAYVAFGYFATTWRPSQGATSASRPAAATAWAVLAADVPTIGGAASGGVELRPDGTFTATLTVDRAAALAAAAGKVSAGRFGIYTYPGGSAATPAFETFTPVEFSKLGTEVVASSSRSVVGALPVVRATVSAVDASAPVGDVEVRDAKGVVRGRGVVADGAVTVALDKPLAAGTHTMTVAFLGDIDYAPATTSAVVTVAKGAAKVAATWPSLTHGRSAKVAVTVTGPVAATGKVTLLHGTKVLATGTLSGGKASLTVPKTLAAGSRTLTVSYGGSSQLDAAKVRSTRTVAKATSAVTAKAATVTTTVRGTVVVTVKATGTVPTGKATVQITRNGRSYATKTVTLQGGTRTVTLPKLTTKGTYTVKVTYAGSSNVKASSRTVSLKVV